MLTSELTSDENVGQNPRFYDIKSQVCIQTSEYFMYDPEVVYVARLGVFPIGQCWVLNKWLFKMTQTYILYKTRDGSKPSSSCVPYGFHIHK